MAADGKSRRIFHAVETLFLDRGDQLPIRNDRRRGIAVIRVDSQNVHPEVVFPSSKTAGVDALVRSRGGVHGLGGGNWAARRLRHVSTHPFIQHEQTPGARPVGLANHEILPRAAHRAQIHVLPQRRREIRPDSCEIRTPSGPRSHTSHGSVNVRLDWPTTSSGSKSESASTSKRFRHVRRVFRILRQPAHKFHQR